MAIDKTKAMVVPDAIHHTDTSETLEYIQGWNDCRQAMLAEQPAQQEPVAWAMYQKGHLLSFWMDKGDAYDFEFTSEHSWRPLYTAPQPAQRKPLTDEEIYMHCPSWLSQEQCKTWVRQIEAAHNIKEST